ncbi:MAG: peptide chain release factor N(5)-glutamine methyltransferase [Defluviitaleaceae bacterium]|nr:peptide chain release factor N(5)-glutamine methyltransferase [Defluviitaleaceae bacterium]
MGLKTIFEALRYGKELIRQASETPGLDAALLLMNATGFSRTELTTRHGELLSDNQTEIYVAALNNRAAGMPVQYILKNAEFMGLNFYVDERVLIPRPDTEILAEAAIAYIKSLASTQTLDYWHTANNLRPCRVLDIGTGSGILAASIAMFTNNVQIIAADVCPSALEVAEINLNHHNIRNRVRLILSDLFKQLSGEQFDLIVSNPPYIRNNEDLPMSVIGFEPHKALFAGVDGLDIYRRILADAKNFLHSNGKIMMEIGYDQYEPVKYLMEIFGYKDIECLKDLAGKDRVITGGL